MLMPALGGQLLRDVLRGSLAVLVLVGLPLAAARAQSGWPSGPDHPELKVKRSYGEPTLTDPAAKITFHDRETVRAYFVEQHGRGKCPDGTSKKDNACLPQGLSAKRYQVGHSLSPAIVSGPIPIELANRLGAPPRGYRYALIDGDFVKVSTPGEVVVDAVDSLVP